MRTIKKLFLVLIFTGNLTPLFSASKRYNKVIYILLDCSKSINNNDFEEYKRQIVGIIRKLSVNSRCLLFAIGESRGGKLIFDLATPEEAGFGKIKLRKWRKKVIPTISGTISKLIPFYSHTDLISPLLYASEFLQGINAKEKILYYFTDGFVSLKDIDFEKDDFDPNQIIKILETNKAIGNFDGIKVNLMGIGGYSQESNLSLSSGAGFLKRRENTEIFWKKYFKLGKAKEINFYSIFSFEP